MRTSWALLGLVVLGGCNAGLNVPETPDASSDRAMGGKDLSGCHSDDDCVLSAQGPRCDLVTGRCQICLPEKDNCPVGTMCIDGFGAMQCASGCRDNSNCGALGGGDTCCSQSCANLATDIWNCGGCGVACARPPNGTQGCAAGRCIVAACDPGYDDCDRRPDNGCETNIQIDPGSCGGCGIACKLTPNAARVDCRRGACVNTCTAGFGDCDGNQLNGCEADLSNNLSNCGRCGLVCGKPNAVATCNQGACTLQCKPGFRDCNANPADGCETDLNADPRNCGGCGNVCAQGRACVMAVCV